MADHENTGLCGIWLGVDTNITATNVEIDASGTPGQTDGTNHAWSGLEVLVKAKLISTGQWVTKFNIVQPGPTWNGAFTKVAYSDFSVNAKGYDEYEGGHRGRVIVDFEESIP